MEITIRGNMQEIMALMGAMSKTEEQRPAKAQSADAKRHTGWNSADQFYYETGMKIILRDLMQNPGGEHPDKQTKHQPRLNESDVRWTVQENHGN